MIILQSINDMYRQLYIIFRYIRGCPASDVSGFIHVIGGDSSAAKLDVGACVGRRYCGHAVCKVSDKLD